MIRICFHGAESTGKSTLAARLQAQCRWPVVPEYGRTWAETHGTDFAMEDLIAIARGQDALMQAAALAAPPVLLLDTDPLMTAAWAWMLFGEMPDELFAYPKADLYLLFAPDTEWVDDGTRFFGSPEDRARFARVCEDVLRLCGVPWQAVSGTWAQREASVLAAVHELQLRK